ncbi:MAG TPA: preprotein translocase subunit YajC [Acidimicrobiales bacterium]
MEALLPLIITFGLMWALLIRPQQRRVRQHQELVATLAVGDEVITTGGMVGTIVSVVDDIVTLEVASGTSIRLLRSAVQTRIAGFGEPDMESFEEAYEAEDEYEYEAPDDDVIEVDEPVEVVAEVEETTYIPPPPATPATPEAPPTPPVAPPSTEEKA